MARIDAHGDVEQIIRQTDGGLNTIAAELAELRSKIAKYDPNAVAEVGRIEKAEAAARPGDGAKMVDALRGTARWVLDFATKVGISVVAKMLESLLGMGRETVSNTRWLNRTRNLLRPPSAGWLRAILARVSWQCFYLLRKRQFF